MGVMVSSNATQMLFPAAASYEAPLSLLARMLELVLADRKAPPREMTKSRRARGGEAS